MKQKAGQWLMLVAIILLSALLVLCMKQAVSADELWVQNQGGLEVVVEYEGDVSLGNTSGIAAINPDYGNGTAKVATATLETEWVVITADTITNYDIEVACNQQLGDVTPEVLMVIDYEGSRISYDPTETTREAVIAALEAFGPPPPPPDATNAEAWVDPFVSRAPQVDDSDGRSIRDMDNEAFLASIDWTGQSTWLFS